MTRTQICFLCLLGAALLTGCGAPPAPTQSTSPQNQTPPAFIPYVPSTRPAQLEVTQDLPTTPRDAQPDLRLVYSVEIWELLLPRDSISSDEGFWKRVNENLVDLSPYTVLFKNGIRVGALPVQELDRLRAIVEERKGSRTQMAGIAGRFIEIPIASDIPGQTIFYLNRSNQLIGKTYERCENLFYFSFEPTPRKPEQIRLILTPAVRGMNKKLQYSMLPGKLEREIAYKIEESQYDANLHVDLSLNEILIVAPSVEARDSHTIGGTFLIKNTPTDQLERLLVVIPRAFKKVSDETAARE